MFALGSCCLMDCAGLRWGVSLGWEAIVFALGGVDFFWVGFVRLLGLVVGVMGWMIGRICGLI